jgi:tryptophan 2,3-dioxygenase
MDTLPQASFLRMRERFPVSPSGLDSPGTRNLRKAAMATWDAFEGVVAARGLTLIELAPATESDHAGDRDVALIADVLTALGRLDWRQVHLTMVWKVLGGYPDLGAGPTGDLPESDGERPTSMRGRPIANLERLAVRPLFPKLWELSGDVYRVMSSPGVY